ncbi:hypothetical protein H6G13_10720 [Pseudanabaena sp. FACHB-2040]|nr:hypothetical protein [Pseudanabaena sp. FACHB-2040]
MAVAAQNSNGFAKRRFRGGALALSLTALLMVACTGNQPQATAPAESDSVTAEDVAEDTNEYIGETVTIRSEPIESVGTDSFTVSDEQFFGSESILVINASGVPFVLPTDSGIDVQVTGEVRNLVTAEVERDFGLTLDPATYEDYENRPAIIAQSIALAPEPGEITQNPDQYYGETLAVTGEIDNVQNDLAFTLDEDQLLGTEDLLVVYAVPKAGTEQPQPAAQPPAIEDGETVAVTGVLRPFVVSELEQDYDLTWDLNVQSELEAEYSNRPVLVAIGVYPSAIPEGAQ